MRRRRSPLAIALATAAVGAAVPATAAAAEGLVLAKVMPSAEQADAVGARTGLDLDGVIAGTDWAVFEDGGDAAAARAALRADGAVMQIDYVEAGETGGFGFIPRDIIFNQPGQVAIAGFGAADWKWHWTKTNFPAAWDISRGSSAVKVLVIDSEFDTEHPDLKTKFVAGRNFDSGTADYQSGRVRATTVNEAFHGTHVAGLVGAASDNAEGGPGACFDCTIIPFKVGLGPGATTTNNVDEKFVRDVTEALRAAGDTDAAVINMSLGTSRDHAPLREAVAYARSRGKVIVAAAGNSQLNTQGPSGVPNYPGAYEGVIAVASTRPDDTIAPTSTNGAYVDVAAPGDSVLSTWDTRLDGTVPANLQPTHGIGYKVLGGTSMASPIVAGLAALVKTIRPDLNPDEVELLIEQGADDLGAGGPDPVYGAGRINALRTLQLAQAYVRPGPPPDTRAAVRVFWSCERGTKLLRAGRKPFVKVPVRARLVCKGRTQPAVRNVFLQIQRYSARGGWKKIGRVKTSNKGRFGFTRRLNTVGNWRIRVAFAGNATLLPSGSLAVKARAIPRT